MNCFKICAGNGIWTSLSPTPPPLCYPLTWGTPCNLPSKHEIKTMLNMLTTTNFVMTVGFHSFVMFFHQYFSFTNYTVKKKSQIILEIFMEHS